MKPTEEIHVEDYTNQELANMTKKEMAALTNSFPLQLNWNKAWTDEQKLILNKINCLRMIDSNFVYGDQFWEKQNYGEGSYACADPYIEEIGEENVRELYDTRKEYFRHHVRIHTDVYTDSEGVPYNSIEEF